eukprot:g8833.t1
MPCEDFIKKTKATIHALETKLEELRHDIQVKTQALSVDELCLRTTSRSLETVSDRSTRPSGSPSYASRPASQARRRTQGAQAARHEVSVHESARNEVLRQQDGTSAGIAGMGGDGVRSSDHNIAGASDDLVEDLNCLTHEATCLNGKPSPAISRQQLPKAMKVDPTFVPNPGHAMIMQLPLTAR